MAVGCAEQRLSWIRHWIQEVRIEKFDYDFELAIFRKEVAQLKNFRKSEIFKAVELKLKKGIQNGRPHFKELYLNHDIASQPGVGFVTAVHLYFNTLFLGTVNGRVYGFRFMYSQLNSNPLDLKNKIPFWIGKAIMEEPILYIDFEFQTQKVNSFYQPVPRITPCIGFYCL